MEYFIFGNEKAAQKNFHWKPTWSITSKIRIAEFLAVNIGITCFAACPIAIIPPITAQNVAKTAPGVICPFELITVPNLLSINSYCHFGQNSALLFLHPFIHICVSILANLESFRLKQPDFQITSLHYWSFYRRNSSTIFGMNTAAKMFLKISKTFLSILKLKYSSFLGE